MSAESTSVEPRSLLDWILELLRDPDARTEFSQDPRSYAASNGFAELSSADVNDALCLIADNRPFSEDRGDNLHIPPPPPVSKYHGRGGGDGNHGAGGDDGATYLRNYITNNYTTVENRHTDIDNSVHQDIDTDGGSFDQVIDNDPVTASGEGSVATGGDIRDSTVTTGDGNVVGNDNQAVTGDDNTSAFGSGNATNASLDDVRFGDGAGVSFGGDASGASSDSDTTTSVENSGSGDTSVTAAGSDGDASQYADQSEQDDSTDSNYDDSSTRESYSVSDSGNSSAVDDSHDVDGGGL